MGNGCKWILPESNFAFGQPCCLLLKDFWETGLEAEADFTKLGLRMSADEVEDFNGLEPRNKDLSASFGVSARKGRFIFHVWKVTPIFNKINCQCKAKRL